MFSLGQTVRVPDGRSGRIVTPASMGTAGLFETLQYDGLQREVVLTVILSDGEVVRYTDAALIAANTA